MKTIRKLSVALLLSAVGLFAANPAPAPNSVQNPGSNFLPGLPSYGAAQGSIIVVYGANLGPTTLVQAQTLPLQTTLSSTSITVTVGSTTVNLLMVYTWHLQLAAVLPSNTPVGNGTLTVTYNGQSGSTPIVVVASAPGILTPSGLGTGPASVTHADGSLITATSAANSNETVVVYATGLSGLAGGSDATAPGAVQFPTANISIYVGGTKLAASAIKYYGRNPSDPGLDQINIAIPPGVTGCTVSLVIQNGTGASAIISNTVTLAVAASGSTCSDANGISTSSLSGKANISIGAIGLNQSSIAFNFPTAARPRILPAQVTAGGVATFQKYTAAQFADSGSAYGISIGSCVITITNGNGSSSNITATGLDAGPQIAVLTPSNGTVNLSTNANVGKGSYISPTSGGFTSIAPGVYHFTGSGGADVGAFTASLTVPTALTWTNQTAVLGSPIVRSNPLTLTWTGGDPSSFVYIFGSSVNQINDNSIGSSFYCIAPVAPGSFTIQPPVLLSVPASNGNTGFGFLVMGTETAPVSFTANGLDVGSINASSYAGGSATFQ